MTTLSGIGASMRRNPENAGQRHGGEPFVMTGVNW